MYLYLLFESVLNFVSFFFFKETYFILHSIIILDKIFCI